ncbi:MAG: hypothetical protein NT159_19285 [Proteobacteria bacterium]|nr:hypothetical protein [Pseudomonadota bacterium]
MSEKIILSTVLLVLLFVTAFLVKGGHGKREKPSPEFPDPRLIADPSYPHEQQAALEKLVALPHFRRLLNGNVVDLLAGTRIERCGCKEYANPHLVLNYSAGNRIALVTRASLEQYVALQQALADQLQSHEEIRSYSLSDHEIPHSV